MRILWLFIVWFIGTFFVWLPLWIIGVFATLYCALTKRYVLTTGWQGPCYKFTDRFMRMWQTRDNGCAPDWYIKNYGPKRPLWLNIWIWSAFRNAVGGNPMHKKIPRAELTVEGDDHPSVDSWKYYKAWHRRIWCTRWIRSGWRIGFWSSKYLGDGSNFKVLDWQFGFKRQDDPDKNYVWLNFTPWDSGRRSR